MAGRFSISSARRAHILDGDRTGGGHRSGMGLGKSEFPPSWSDDDIVGAILSVANDLALIHNGVMHGRHRVVGTRQGVTIAVILDHATGEVVTGYPVYPAPIGALPWSI